MSELLLLLVTAALVNNFVLVQFLGLCPFMGVSNRFDTALPMGLATAFVLTVSSLAAFVMHHYVLVPLDLGYLRIVAFIVAIAGVVQFTEAFVRLVSPLLHQVLGIYLPLITSNCAVLGVALIVTDSGAGLLQTIAVALGAAVGFSIVIVCFAALRERLETDAIAPAAAGIPVALITVGIMSLAFHGLKGLGQ
ncbi:MAG: electron transport complex subunit RsxA [Gammaproteobacteria bacterium]|nr:electron transport complex subunit RsxA [Gammaproteobacteria bacterium]MDE0225695.1 electron transport complex subunit RsxA [Gammaproteobacteria bacterium]